MSHRHRLSIGGIALQSGATPLVIAEMSGNHNQSLERAFEIVDAVARTGVQAVKLQTYTADTMTIDCDAEDFVIADPGSLWHGRSLYELYTEAHTPWDWHGPIFERCKRHGLLCFSSPFDATAVDFLEEFDPPCYKVASFEIVDLPLIRHVAATGKPIIMSTGMASIVEIEEAVQAARDAGCRDLILLKCTSSYPASPAQSNLATIRDMRERFDCAIGLSDHTLGIGVPVASVALGAVAIEKHVTLRRADGGVDAAFSLEPAELRMMMEELTRAAQAVGVVSYGALAAEKTSLSHRRSLYVVQEVAAGAVLTKENVRAIRPGRGLAPKHIDAVLGRKVREAVMRGTPLSWELLQ